MTTLKFCLSLFFSIRILRKGGSALGRERPGVQLTFGFSLFFSNQHLCHEVLLGSCVQPCSFP